MAATTVSSQQFNSDGVAYRHIKLKGVTGVTGDGGNYFSTSEVEFYENRLSKLEERLDKLKNGH